MYQFILNCWTMDKIKDEEDIRNFVTKGFITEAEAALILASPENK